jgi:DNA-binding HxlR family transcriptional regulator
MKRVDEHMSERMSTGAINEAACHVLKEIVRLLGSHEGNNLIRILLEKGPLPPTKLISYSGISSTTFNNVMKALVGCNLTYRKVHEDSARTVTYQITCLVRKY